MKIRNILRDHRATAQKLFAIYGIKQPVNYDTVSAAITLYSSDNGNPFLTDLINKIGSDSTEDYDEILGLGKKGKARRAEKREARGGYSRIGAIARKVGIGKNRPAQANKMSKEAVLNNQAASPITDGTENNEAPPQNKVTLNQVLDGVSKGAGVLGGIVDTIRGGGDGGGNMTTNEEEYVEEKKWYQKPIVLIGIGVGAIALVGILIAVFRGKKK